MYPFKKGKYQQTLPNPKNPEELFAVQIFEEYSRDLVNYEDLDEAPKYKDGKSLSMKFTKHKLTAMGGGDNSDDDEEEDGAALVELFKESTLQADYDQVIGGSFVPYAQYSPLDSNESQAVTDMKRNGEVATIESWRINEQGLFECYHCLVVPNPITRIVDEKGEQKAKQFLF